VKQEDAAVGCWSVGWVGNPKFWLGGPKCIWPHQ